MNIMTAIDRPRPRQRLRASSVTVFLAAVLAALMLVMPNTADAQGQTARVLYLPLDNLPDIAADGVQELLSTEGQLLSTAKYRRAARRRGFRYSSLKTMKRMGRKQNPNIIVVAGYRSVRRRRMRITFRDGENAGKLREIEFRLPRSGELTRKQRRRILRTLRLAIGEYAERNGETVERKGSTSIIWPKKRQQQEDEQASTEDEANDSETNDNDADDETSMVDEDDTFDESGKAGDEAAEPLPERSSVYLSLRAGGGMGHRSIKLPTPGGNIRLKTAPFATGQVHLQVGVNAKSGHYVIGAEADYESSVALSLADQREDGSTRTVNTRSSRMRVGAFSDIRLGEKGPRSPFFRFGAGFNMHFFVTEQSISVPRYSMLGPYLQPGFFLPIGSGPLTVGIVPQAVLFVRSSGALRNAGVNNLGASIGAELQAEYFIKSWLRAGFVYSEHHVFAATNEPGQFRDTMRSLIIRLLYYM